MRNFADNANAIFDKSTVDYHIENSVKAVIINPYQAETIDAFLYEKNWIDVVQWHLEDIIRDPEIDAKEALGIKRWIDRSNQERTDLVEKIDSYFFYLFDNVEVKSSATLNTESPAWAVDRLSILAVKIYHMQEEANRSNASSEHVAACRKKLEVLLEQRRDLSLAINQLLDDYRNGKKVMKVYKQMKMYNDPALNPVLYGKK